MPVKLTTGAFIHRSRQIHREKYDYSRVTYRGANTPVEIICPLHGAFLQRPISHTTGHGFRKCGDEKTGQAKLKTDDWSTIEGLLTQAIEKLGGRFPSHSDVVQHGWWEIDRVTKKLGGYRAARLRFGFKELEKAKGYWDNWDNIALYLRNTFLLYFVAASAPLLK